VAHSPADLNADALELLTARHLATLTTLRTDGSPHVVPVGFTWDPERSLARVITSGTSVKARLAARGGRVAICQVDGGRWLTLEGTSSVSADPAAVADAVARYAARYRQPRVNPARVVVEVAVTRVLGSASLLAP
jgi:PPOX class probable F420-dependent enzyme